jgi:hypothetical protein
MTKKAPIDIGTNSTRHPVADRTLSRKTIPILMKKIIIRSCPCVDSFGVFTALAKNKEHFASDEYVEYFEKNHIAWTIYKLEPQ